MRYITPHVIEDLKTKMVFVGGPRQSGKTTLAKSVLEKTDAYLNWDSDRDRRRILHQEWAPDARLIVLDEVHKYRRWKNWLKGLHDTTGDQHRFLVTGSARLDVYRRGGDSMLGRYHYWRLHPFTLSELPQSMRPSDAFERLMTLGGFPEPFLRGDLRHARRWRRERLERVIRTDVRDLEDLRDVTLLESLVDLLRSRVGSLTVASNLAGDLEVAPRTVQRWIDVLEKMYLVFIVRPFTTRIARAVRKPPKIYFFDNGDVEGDSGAVFENLVATHLLKRIHFLQDRDGYRYELRYLRDKDGREVDFVILRERSVYELWEAKWTDKEVSTSLKFYTERLKPRRSIQVVAQLKHPFRKHAIDVMPPWNALRSLEEEISPSVTPS